MSPGKIETVKDGIGDSAEVCAVPYDDKDIKMAGLTGEELSGGNAEIEALVDRISN